MGVYTTSTPHSAHPSTLPHQAPAHHIYTSAAGANPPYDDNHKDERDGIYLLPFGTAAAALSGEWRQCCHGSWRDRSRDRAPKILSAHHPVRVPP